MGLSTHVSVKVTANRYGLNSEQCSIEKGKEEANSGGDHVGHGPICPQNHKHYFPGPEKKRRKGDIKLKL